MATDGTAEPGAVGPVLMAGPITDAIVSVIRRHHPAVEILDRGSYLRVLVPGRCAVSRAHVEAALRRPFRLPGDLERVMTSFRGRFAVSAEEASWTSPSQATVGATESQSGAGPREPG
jgi:hypothetical protein